MSKTTYLVEKKEPDRSLGKTRAFELFPTAYITLISVVQAIALESAIESISRVVFTDAVQMTAYIWLEAAFLVHVIAAVWIHYIVMIIPMRWRIGLADFVVPFGIAFCIFIAIAWLGRGTNIPLFATIFIGFAVGSFHVPNNAKRAKEEPLNARLPDRFPVRRICTPYVILSIIGALGLAVIVSVDTNGSILISLVCAAHLVLMWSTYEWLRWWNIATSE